MKCPYCRQTLIRSSSSLSTWVDFGVRFAESARVFVVSRVRGDSLREMAKQFIDPDSRPQAGEFDRLCPYCRRGRVSRDRRLLSLDLAVVLAGLTRAAVEARAQGRGPLERIAELVLDADRLADEFEADVIVHDDEGEEDEPVDDFDADAEDFDRELGDVADW